MHAYLDRPFFAWACGIVLGAALAGCLWLVLGGEALRSLGPAAIAVTAAAALLARRILPAAFGLLLTVAVAVNAAGYVLTLWHERTAFDEIVHAFTSFAGMAAIGWLVLKRRMRPGLALLWQALAIGLVIGVAWEGFEWAIGIIGSRRDTAIDLLMDGVGALLAAMLLLWLAKHRHGSPRR